MNKILQSINNYFESPHHIPKGLYTYRSTSESLTPQKMYLRVEEDGNSILVINASTIVHLNPVATEIAYGVINSWSNQKILNSIQKKYRVSKHQAESDIKQFLEKLDNLQRIQDLDPIEFFGLDRVLPYQTTNLSAPYRLDCAVTYHLPPGVPTYLAPTDRVKKELDTNEWITILHKAKSAGIPHIIFTGGEPTLRDDLIPLIAQTEENGQISGLITTGYKLDNSQFLTSLLSTGLDHITFLLDNESELTWKVIENTAAQDIFTTVHLTLNLLDQSIIEQIISRLAHIKVNGVSFSASSIENSSLLKFAQDKALAHEIRLVWDLPVPYSSYNPVNLDMVNDELINGAAKAWLYIEPDGDVLPSQGINTVLGNMLEHEWNSIWSQCKAYATTVNH